MMTYVELAAALGGPDFTRNGGRLLRKSSFTIDIWRRRYKNTDVSISVFDRVHPNFQAPLIGPMYFEMDGSIEGSWHAALRDVRDATVRLVRVLVDDLQVPEGLIRVSFSGSKGFHVMCAPKVYGVMPHAQLNTHYRCLALAIAAQAQASEYLDKGVYDARRVLRLLHSVNSKGTFLAGRPVFKTPVTINELGACSIDHLLELASCRTRRRLPYEEPVPVPKAIEAYQEAVSAADVEKMRRMEEAEARQENLTELRGLPKCMAYLLEYGAPNGFRNNAIYLLASFLHTRKGMTTEEILEEVGAFSGLDAVEIANTVRSAVSGDYHVGCRSPHSQLRMLIDDGVTICDSDVCPVLEGF